MIDADDGTILIPTYAGKWVQTERAHPSTLAILVRATDLEEICGKTQKSCG